MELHQRVGSILTLGEKLIDHRADHVLWPLFVGEIEVRYCVRLICLAFQPDVFDDD